MKPVTEGLTFRIRPGELVTFAGVTFDSLRGPGSRVWAVIRVAEVQQPCAGNIEYFLDAPRYFRDVLGYGAVSFPLR